MGPHTLFQPSEPQEQEGRRTIFRQRAVKHYLEGREGDVLPQFISPRSFYLLWVVFALLVISMAAGAYFAKIPIYATGSAVAVEENSNGNSSMVAFLPPKYLEELKRGEGDQELLVRLGSDGERQAISVSSVIPEVVSPEEAKDRFGLSDAQKSAVRKSAVVTVAPLEELPQGLNATRAYQAEVEVGSQRVISLVPVVGESFEEEGR